MKKKLLFMLINMNVGGTEKALLNMIAEMPKDQYDITILMLEEKGGFLGYIPDGVRVKYLPKFDSIKEMLNKPPRELAINLIRKGNIINAISLLTMHYLSKLAKDRGLFFKYIARKYPKINDDYDVAVAYAGPMDFISYFVADKIKAKKKIQWIHFDVTKIGFDTSFASKNYSNFDKIFVVSEEAKHKLILKLPEIKERTEVFLNLISPQIIYAQANESNGFTDGFEGLRILTVGRLAAEKGQDLAIRALARLIEKGYKVKWYCLGDGKLRKEYEQLVEQYKLKDYFIFLGSNPNPYPFIAQCDIYVQSSRHEGYCITLAEARCLNKPIITSDFTGAKEQIIDGETGLIVHIDEEDLYIAVKNLIDDRDLCKKFSVNLAKEKFNNEIEMTKLYSCI